MRLSRGSSSISEVRVGRENPFVQFSRRHIPSIDRQMKTFFDRKARAAPYPFIREMFADLQEYCLREGKRVRPLLLLLACEAYGEPGTSLKPFLPAAAAVEMMHSFLLIQDDIIDRSDLRRGQKTLHILSRERYGRLTKNPHAGDDIALILADVLFAGALEMVGGAALDAGRKNEFLKIFASTYEMTAWGQILDILHSLPAEVDLPEIPEMIGTLKTAHYTIYYPLLMGLVLSGNYSRKEERRIRDFALPLGLSFQIRDDMLGVFGSEKEIGKPASSDLQEGKMTFLVQDTLTVLNARERREFLARFSREKKSREDLEFLRGIILTSGARDKSRERQERLLALGRKNLQKLSLREKQKALFEGLIEVMSPVEREKK